MESPLAEKIKILPVLKKIKSNIPEIGSPGYLPGLLDILGVNQSSPKAFAETIPFSLNDTTAGSENEFHVAVVGRKTNVDLPVSIENSNFYKNLVKRAGTGDIPKKIIHELNGYLNDNLSRVWENSWVVIPRSVLCPYACRLFDHDLLSDKNDPAGPLRNDAGKFLVSKNGEEFLRVPVSYLLKLSLIDAVYSNPNIDFLVKSVGDKAANHFLNDNTSPETYSFFPVPLNGDSTMGKELAHETSIRFLLTQFLVMYANTGFQLLSMGQQAMLYFAPHPPIRQKVLNEIIPDSYYRALFMNPCLSGWDQGEKKYEYMGMCHRVLSRSQLNAVLKLRDAGIITNNLCVLPNISNMGLANNATHISLGSRKITALLKCNIPEFSAKDEKYLGDLVIKVAEHFFPLFVGSYSAAPYRLDFWDFHPERALGFLPHELDYTHLRMIWRRWKKKASINIFNQPLTPFGPKWLDVTMSKIFGLRGDYVQDFRLIDYFVSLMSTYESSALDGHLGNGARLKEDLADLGVFDKNIALYLLYRAREFSKMGFSGFEGRHYSLFESLIYDMGEATNLQTLITALAYKYILKGYVDHGHIPDDPTIESERRQIIFGTAIGIPTFFVRKNTTNRFMLKILKKTQKNRLSHRYPGYIRVYNLEYRKALMEIIKEDALDLIEILGLRETLKDLERRITGPAEYSAAGRLMRGILKEAGVSSPMKLSGEEFNQSAEEYYRKSLRRYHIEEAMSLFEVDLAALHLHANNGKSEYRDALRSILGDKSATEFLVSVKTDVIDEKVHSAVLKKLIHLLLLVIHYHTERYKTSAEG